MSTTFVLPGDPIPSSSGSSLTLGPGILSSTSRSLTHDHKLGAVKPGLLISSTAKSKGKGRAAGEEGVAQEALWIESSSKRYIAAPRDLVLGTIIARHAEGYRVDIGSAQMAQLDALAFEGATKRSKPNLKVGTLVYARLSIASRDMEPEIECVDPATGKSDGFGELKGGLVINCSLQLSRQLLQPKFPLLPTLAGQIPFETAIGINGRVWIKSSSISETIALSRVLEAVNEGSVDVEKKELERVLKEYLA